MATTLDVAKTREKMAIIYQYQGHYDQALEIYKSVLETKIRVCGHEHPDVAKSYLGLGSVYYRQGQYERALKYYQKALEINIKVSGQDHPDVAMSYGLLIPKSGCGVPESEKLRTDKRDGH